MGYYVFDVETAGLPPEHILGMAPDFEAPSNWKDPAKIEAEIARKREQWLLDAALSPLTGQVIAVGIKACHGLAALKMGLPENELLGWFWEAQDKLVAADFAAKFVGFYSNRFDLPFLLRRSWKHGVAVPEFIVNGTYLSDRFIDLARRWELGNREDRISLDRLCKFLGVGEKTGNGKDFAELLKTDPAKAEEYLRTDLSLTELCARRMGMIP